MKQKEIFKKIGGIIKELSDQYEYLETTADELNDLELELFAANAHFLADHIEVLCKLNMQNPGKQSGFEKPDKFEKIEKAAKVEKPEKPEKHEKTDKPAKQEFVREEKYFEPVVQQMKHHPEKATEKKAKETPKETEAKKHTPEESATAFIEEIEAKVEENNYHEDYTVPEIDLSHDGTGDSYSYTREEPEIIRHELVLDEAMDYDDDEKPAPEIAVETEPEKTEESVSLLSEPVFELTGSKIEEIPQEEIKAEEIQPEEVQPETIWQEEAKAKEIELETIWQEETKAEEVEPGDVKPKVVWQEETKPEEIQPEEVKSKVFWQEEAKPEEIQPEEIKPKVFWQEEAKPEPIAPPKKEEDILTINQRISSQLGERGMGRTEQLAIKPISDIKLAITLNDKLLYVKDLFNGYNLAYSEAVEILNRFNTFEEASRFLKTNYVTKNNWESKPATVEKFYALLKRRYA